MTDNLGYNKKLIILAFDHRSSFIKTLLNIEGRQPTKEEIEKIINAKKIIYEGFKKAVEKRIPKENAAILVDEQFGDEFLKDAKKNDFEYGSEFATHIEKYHPTFAKALVRFNPEDNKDDKNLQLEKIKQLSDYCHKNNYKF